MRIKIASGILALALAATAGNLVQNSTFSEDEPEYGGIPSKWQVEKAECWEFIDDDGVFIGNEGSNCLRFKGKGNEGAPIAWQELTPAGANGRFVVLADLKSNGCTPTVLVRDAKGEVLASLKPSKSSGNSWQNLFKEFDCKDGRLKVELQGCMNGESGTSCFDNVRVMTGGVIENQKEIVKRAKFTPGGPNLALGKKYKILPRPNYGYCTDPDDAIQLTDGIYTNGYFWTQKSTVGWQGGRCDITIDLGKHENILGASFNSAGGKAGVPFPSSISVFTSDDEKQWSFAGDLVELGIKNGAPSPDVYSIFRYATNELKTSGRYVRFLVASSVYLFVDEIEIYGGGDGGKATIITDNPDQFTQNRASCTGAMLRLKFDLDKMEQALEDAGAIDAKVLAELKTLREKIPATINEFNPEARVIIPYLPLQERIFALNANLMARAGYTRPFVWKNSRWDNLGVTDIPKTAGVKSIEVEMMRNEVRGETINICNPTSKRLECSLTVEGIPADANLIVNNVLFTDTSQHVVISDAIVPSGKKNAIDLSLYAGCNSQIWFSFKRPSCKGTHNGTVKVVAGGASVATIPLKLVVHDIEFPKLPSIHVGGWDYTNTMGRYYGTPDNLENTIAIMRDTYVDSPWATNAVMPGGAKYDKEGHLTNPKELDFSEWNKWTKMWAGSRKYCVFWAIGSKFHGVPPTDPRFNNMITEYINAWMAYVKSTGFNPKDVVVLLFDEPHSPEDAKHVIEWSRPIKERCPDFTLFQDPTFGDPRPVDPEFFKVNDILCPNTRMMHAQWKFAKEDPNFKGNFRDFYVQKRKEGAELWQYSCSGPSRLLDPITYHRGQFWRCVDTGAVGSMYWAFGCGGGIGSSWHPYAQKGNEYSPYFVGKTTVTDAKHNEAIREGAQDYEYFMMLAKKIAALKAQGKDKEAKAAQAVYDTALEKGLSSLPHLKENSMEWTNSNQHELMDAARIAVLRELAK